MFIALNSDEFCQKWIYGDNGGVLLTLEKFLLILPSFMLLVTMYIALFVPEKDYSGDKKDVPSAWTKKKDKDSDSV